MLLVLELDVSDDAVLLLLRLEVDDSEVELLVLGEDFVELLLEL